MRVPMLLSSWLDLTFVHWRVPPAQVQRLLPRGLTVDQYDGSAWVGLTPFRMVDMRPLGLPAVPYVSSTLETNLRTYVRGPDGRDGVWFLTLDVASVALAVALRTAIGLPYRRARLAVERVGDTVVSTGTRPGHERSYRVEVGVGDPVEPSDLEVWLTSRWRAYSCHLGQLLSTPVEHEPWPLRTARLEVLDQDVTGAFGVHGLSEPPLVHFSEGVAHVRIGPPAILRKT